MPTFGFTRIWAEPDSAKMATAEQQRASLFTVYGLSGLSLYNPWVHKITLNNSPTVCMTVSHPTTTTDGKLDEVDKDKSNNCSLENEWAGQLAATLFVI